jgi:carbonic anhydrase
VIEQVANVCQTTVIEDVRARDQELTLPGPIYGLEDGLLHDPGVSVSLAERAGA